MACGTRTTFAWRRERSLNSRRERTAPNYRDRRTELQRRRARRRHRVRDPLRHGKHLSDWLKMIPGLAAMSRAAMAYANVTERKTAPYNTMSGHLVLEHARRMSNRSQQGNHRQAEAELFLSAVAE